MNPWPLTELTRLYGINMLNTESKGKILYIEAEDNRRFALKRSTLQAEELDLEIEICEHLYRQGFNNLARIVPTCAGEGFAQLGQSKFLLTNWLDGYHPDFADAAQLKLATQGLAKFHQFARDYTGKVFWQKRLLYGVWPQRFGYRLSHILWYQKCIQGRGVLDEFDELFMSYCPVAIHSSIQAIQALRSDNYYRLAAEARNSKTICHHDVAYHNIIIDSSGEVGFLDFDYCLLDQPLHDLANLLWHTVKLSKWTFESTKSILLSYHEQKPISSGELEILFHFLNFPQDFWQLAWAKYSELGLHDPAFLLVRLQKLVASHELRNNFLTQLKELSYSENFLPGRDSL